MSKPAPHDATPERLQKLQMDFAGHLRNPEAVPPPNDVEERRMAIYRRLFFNNILNFISGNYPVLKSLHDKKDWRRLVRDFFVEHRCTTPLFPELPREFLRYLQESRGAREGDLPFMLELAHYEWVELALANDACDLDTIKADPGGDLLDEVPVLSPLAWPLSYNFPVHLICEEFQPDAAPGETTHLLVYRRRDDKVRFMKINAVSRLLLEQLKANEEADEPLGGRALLRDVARSLGYDEPDALLAAGKNLMDEWRQKDIILGSRPIRT